MRSNSNSPMYNKGLNKSLNVSQIDPVPHPYTFESQNQSNESSHILKTDKDQDTSQSECRQIESEYKLRLESVVKGYEMKLSKQKETFQLKQMKYEEEIGQLKKQLKQYLFSKSQKVLTEKNQHCSICSDGEVLQHMKNMLEMIQTDHQGCITQKRNLNSQIMCLQQKVSVLDEESERTETKYQKMKQEAKSLKNEKDIWEREKRQRQRIYRQKERQCQTRQIQLEQEISKTKGLKKELEYDIERAYKIEKEEEIKRNKDRQMVEIKEQNEQHNHPRTTNNIYSSIARGSGAYAISQGRRPYRQQKQNYGGRIPKRSFIEVNDSHTIPSWKTKMQESFTEYAGRKRGGRGGENSILKQSSMNQFDTFRPNYHSINRYNYLQ